MIKVKNLDQAFAAIDRWLDSVEEQVADIAVSLTYIMLGEAVKTSSQYSGDFAANWKLSRNRIDTTFQAGIFPEKTFPVPEGQSPFQRGDMQPMMYAVRASTGVLAGAKLGDTLWLSNSATHNGDTYAWKLEGNLIRLRPVNYGGEGPLRQVREYMKVHYSRIDKNTVRLLK